MKVSPDRLYYYGNFSCFTFIICFFSFLFWIESERTSTHGRYYCLAIHHWLLESVIIYVYCIVVVHLTSATLITPMSCHKANEYIQKSGMIA